MHLDNGMMQARAFGPVLVFLIATWMTSPLHAASPSYQENLNKLPKDVAQTVQSHFLHLKKNGLDFSLLENKLNEGLAKGVSPPKIAHVLGHMKDNLLWTDAQIKTCVFAKKTASKLQVLRICNDLLLGALDRDDVQKALVELCGEHDAGDEFSAGLELFSYVHYRLRADPKKAWDLVLVLMQQKRTEAAKNSLIRVLQEIFESSGGISGALEYASRRCRSGSSLRTIAHELRDRFMRP